MALKSWLTIPRGSHFSLSNIPFGIISTASNSTPRPAVAIGDHVLDLSDFASGDGFAAFRNPPIDNLQTVFSKPSLNAFAALGQIFHEAIRKYLQDVFSENTPYPSILKENETLRSTSLISQGNVQNHLPMEIGDYTDFFAGINHAFNVRWSSTDLDCGVEVTYFFEHYKADTMSRLAFSSAVPPTLSNRITSTSLSLTMAEHRL
jgi:fumarylacetoacetase